MSIVSNNIKYLRRLNGLTQEQFARRIGIKRSLLGAYEEARANPNLDNLKVIANTFGVSVDNLIKQDIRKLRDTPDLTFNFQPKPAQSTSQPPTNSQNFSSQPRQIGELVNNFMQSPPPTPIMPQKRGTGINLVSQRIVFKPVNKNENFNQNNYSTKPLTFNNIFEKESTQRATGGVPYNQTLSSHQIIQLVKKNQLSEYLNRYQDSYFLKNLTEFQIPSLPIGEYRAFEANDDFAFPNALLIGSFVRNWFEIQDGKNYVIVTKSQGIIYRRVYNQVKIKGILLLTSDIHSLNSHEISIKDVLEAWEVRAFISQKLPEPSVSFDKLNNLVDELKFEIDKIKR